MGKREAVSNETAHAVPILLAHAMMSRPGEAGSRFRRGVQVMSQVRGAHPRRDSNVAIDVTDALLRRVPKHYPSLRAARWLAYWRVSVTVTGPPSPRLRYSPTTPHAACFGWVAAGVGRVGRGRLGRPGVNGLSNESLGASRALQLSPAFFLAIKMERRNSVETCVSGFRSSMDYDGVSICRLYF